MLLPCVALINPTPTRAAIDSATDLNKDSKMDVFDYNVLVGDFGKTGEPGWILSDINEDGKIDIFDYNLLVQNFGKADIVPAEELLKDSKFAHGFGACWEFGQNWYPVGITQSNSTYDAFKIGNCHSYRVVPSPYTISLIPDGPTSIVSNQNKYWEFNDGYHKNYVDENGQTVPELFINNMSINHVIEQNTPNLLSFSQKNKDGAVAKKVTTDKNGTIVLYFNTKNDIRNVANKYGSEFANDTWPHFQLNQNFHKVYDLAKYKNANVSMKIKVNSMNILPGWPYAGITGYSPPEMNLNFFGFIREKAAPYGMFVGTAIYTTNPSLYADYLSVDQWGQGFYRANIKKYAGPPTPGQTFTLNFDLIDLINQARAQKPENGNTNNVKPAEDYNLQSVAVGFEGMGWSESEFEIKDFSIVGILK